MNTSTLIFLYTYSKIKEGFGATYSWNRINNYAGFVPPLHDANERN